MSIEIQPTDIGHYTCAHAIPDLIDEQTGRTIYETLAADGRIELAAPLLMLGAGEG